MVALSFALGTYAEYAVVTSPFNYYQTIASVIFWATIVLLALSFPLRHALNLFAKGVKTIRGFSTFVIYAPLHLLLYGLLLEAVLGFVYRIPASTHSYSLYLASTPLYPLSFPDVIAGFGFNPSLSLILPPLYDLGMTAYSVSIALIISILVTANVTRIVTLGKVCTTAQKSRAFVLLPLIGVVGGAACCLSLPVLISLIAPAAAAISNSPVAYYVASFVFPPVTAIALSINLNSTDKMANKLKRMAVITHSS